MQEFEKLTGYNKQMIIENCMDCLCYGYFYESIKELDWFKKYVVIFGEKQLKAAYKKAYEIMTRDI